MTATISRVMWPHELVARVAWDARFSMWGKARHAGPRERHSPPGVGAFHRVEGCVYLVVECSGRR